MMNEDEITKKHRLWLKDEFRQAARNNDEAKRHELMGRLRSFARDQAKRGRKK